MVGTFIFENDDDDNEMQTYVEVLDDEERVEHEKRQLVLAVLCYLFPFYDNLSIKNNGDSGTKPCGCCDGYLATYYDFLFNRERLCSVEEFINDNYLATLEFDKDFEVLSDASFAHLTKQYKSELHVELLAVTWHPDRAMEWCFEFDFVFASTIK